MSSKTEQPTRQRRERARREGQLPRSRLFTSAAVTSMGLWAFGESLPGAWRELSGWTAGLLALPLVSPARALQDAGRHALTFLIPCLAAALVTSFTAAVMVAGWQVHVSLLLPKLERLNPAKGVARLVSPRTVVELAKSLGVAVMVAGVFVWQLRGAGRPWLSSSVGAGPGALLPPMLLLRPAIARAAGTLLLLGLADYGLARWRLLRDLRMTREEVRREHRESEGDPQAKGRRRSLHRQLAQGGPARGVSAATAVVVNPTHLAVALRYAPSECDAPYLVAKGRDADALALRAEARASAIPIVKDIALARSLIHYDVGEEIPEELYRAAAAVLKVAHERGAAAPSSSEESA